jgi:hypothetical protein
MVTHKGVFAQFIINEFDWLLANSLVHNNWSMFIKVLVTFTMVNLFKFIQNLVKYKLNWYTLVY